MIGFKELTDRDLADKLDQAVVAEKFAESIEWSLIQEAADRLAARAHEELLDTDVAVNPSRAQELQITVKVLRNLLPGIVSGLKEEGRLAFAELKERKYLDDA